MQDYYEVLGVDRNATEDVIRHVYRRLAQAYHPDVMPDNEAGVARLKLINAAYDTLADPDKRRRYDARLGVPPTTAAPPRPDPHSSQEESRKHAAEAKRARETRAAEERAKQTRRAAEKEAERQREARRAAEELEAQRQREARETAERARAAQEADRQREESERQARLAEKKRAREEAQRKRQEAATAVEAMMRVVGKLAPSELAGLIEGLQAARTELALATLRRLAEFAGPAGPQAAEAAKQVEGLGTRSVGVHIHSDDKLMTPANAARSIAKKTNEDLGRSLGRVASNPAAHNVSVLRILAAKPLGRAGVLARVALGQDE